MGNASLEYKLIQNLEYTKEEVIYEILLDLHKAYDELYRERCMDILMVYGVSPQYIHLLWRYQDCIIMVSKAGG